MRVFAQRALAAAVLVASSAARLAATTEVDDYLRREMAARSIPGVAWAAVDGDAIAAQGCLGLASVELDAPVTAGSVFAVASLDKQLTAAGVMVLAQRGKLSLDDPLSKWVPGEWGAITLRHLLSHTSGLPDSVAPAVLGTSLLDYTADSLLGNVRALVPVAPPGERYVYSDANLFLAQLATEAAAGEPWRDFVRREVFAAAGMVNATFMDPLVVIPGRAAPYTLDGEGKLVRDRRLEVDYGPLYNDLGMTARDFARWLIALGGERPLTRASREAMWMPVPLADGAPNEETWQWRRYGLGVGLDSWGGHRVVTHSGHSGVGFFYLPDERRGVVVFTNLAHGAGSDPIGLAWDIAGRLWPELALAATPAASDPDAAGTAALRTEYERLLAGTPELDLWSLRSRISAWEGASSLAGRSSRLGALRRFSFVREERDDKERRRYYLAEHAKGTLLLRFALDANGRIVSLTWMHL
ncbi:MAG TPA: serine hydrolase domain-containing protein [Thermoanaerobaculia bacterium]|nr:serine hydrolase domain-containing protein [Thermoanaerobaculia bacterium]